MRLIRLTSTDPQAIFDNDFKQDILITPQSKICLKSMSIENVNSQVTINSDNDLIQFQVQSTQGTLTSRITHGDYTSINAPSLFNNMSKVMNAKLRTIGTGIGGNIGMEVRNQVGNDRKFVSEFKQATLQENQQHIVKDHGAVAVSENTGVYSVVLGTPSGNNAYFYDPSPMARGGGVARFRINKISTGGDNFIFGLTTTNPDTLPSGGAFDITKIKLGIKCGDSSVNYDFIENGVLTGTAIAPNYINDGDTNNDSVVLCIDEGKIKAVVYQSSIGGTNPGTNVLKEIDYNYPEDLYPVVILLRNNTSTSIQLFRFTQSPYHREPVDPIPNENLTFGLGVNEVPPNQSKVARNHYLEFESSSLSSFLGYNSPRIPQTGTEKTKHFIAKADNIFIGKALSDAFLVELLNIQLMSYDGFTSERKSFISVVPETDRENFIIYDSKFPVFIDIDNAQPLTIRNLKARILYADGTPVSMRGLGTIVLLIKDKEEN